MNNYTIYYCYDAYCGWCYGFSKVIQQLEADYGQQMHFEVLSGGMILPEQPVHIGTMAGFIQKAYKTVEEYSGVQFGKDFLWHIENPEQSDWFPNSEKPAIALCIFKEYHPDKQVQFAAALQYALKFEGRDLTDDEAYRHLLSTFHIPEEEFYTKLHSEVYKEKAHYEFALCKQLQVKGYPCVLIQVDASKFYLLANGYTSYENLQARVNNVLAEQTTLNK